MKKLWLFMDVLQRMVDTQGTSCFSLGSFIKHRIANRSYLFLVMVLSYTSLMIAQGQSFPVQIIPQAVPPAPIFLSDYADATTSNGPLRVQLILNDFTLSNREVRLKAFFEGNGIAFQSNTNVVGASPIFLEGGIPTLLTNAELAPYFRFENITGVSPNAYGQPIPEGAYRFCFEIFDVATGRRLSTRSCVTTVIFKNEPPFLVAPLNKSNIEQQNPQNIVFQWTPRHINVSNVEYELSIVEVWDSQVDPQTAFLSSPPVFQTRTNATTYVYGPADPLFLSNKKYAWRVQAIAKQGTEEIGLFKNNGYSEIFSFSYATPCDVPLSVTTEIKGAHQVNINWEDFTTEIPKFNVRYRKQGDNGDWFYSKTSANWVTLWDLRAETTYEFQINKRCAVSESEWTFVDTFTTAAEQDETAVINCGIPPDINLDNQDPLPSIEVGETFLAGDFNVKIQEVSGSEGRFTGKGYVTVPYLKSIKVAVKFTNVLINTDKQLAEGMVITVYDPTLSNIVDVDEAIDTVTDVVEAVGEVFEGDNDLDEININFDITEDDITIEDGRIVITNPDTGDKFDYPLGDDTVITDASGDVYHVDEDGNITKGGIKDQGGIVSSNNVNGVSRDGDLESLTAPGLVVSFTGTGTYGFDEVPESQKDKLTEHYETVKDAAGNDYTLVHQAVKKGDSTKITASVRRDDTTYALSDIIFKTKQGEKLTAKVQTDSTIAVTVAGHYTFEHETIYAVVPSKTEDNKQLTAGAFTLWHLTEREVNVVLVPVNDARLQNNEAQDIFNIFKQGVAKVNVSVASAFTFDKNNLGANGLDVGESPWLTAYNDEQKSIMAAFKQDPNAKYNKNNYYIFVFNDITPSKDIAGFMPLQRQYGFVFNSKTRSTLEGKDNLTKTIAHEIGHGVFALTHPFKSLQTDEGQTQWLMDYSNGDILPHMHWSQIHNPELKFYIFQDEEDGQYETDGHFSTVYLVSLMLGMEEGKAKELAKYSERPDTNIHSETKYEIDQTWSYRPDQLNTHSLTNGFHGTEELITALLFFQTDKTNLKELGRLLHRYGDTYAHTEISNSPDWNQVESYDISKKFEPWMDVLNSVTMEEGLEFLTNDKLQKEVLDGKTLEEYLYENWSNSPSDKFKMYGDHVHFHGITLNYTTEHALTDDKGTPDYIYVRPKWYLTYVKNLAKVIAYKFDLDPNRLNMSVFKRMVDYASHSDRKISLKGIIDFEIARIRGKNHFYIPVFYSSPTKIFASIDAVFLTDYVKVAEDALKNSREYMLNQGIEVKKVEEKHNYFNPKVNTERFWTIEAYKISY